MLYELTTLSCPLLALDDASEGARAWLFRTEAKGQLLGCWRTDIGTLGRLLVLRGFAAADEMMAERRRALLDGDPFGAGRTVTALTMESFEPFPFLPPVRPAAFGRYYEFRTYRLKPAGVPPTLAGWSQAVGPAREYTAHLVVNMYGLDGAPRVTHIWGFASLEERAALRAKVYAAGLWPPPGGPDQIVEAPSIIGVPESYSPLS